MIDIMEMLDDEFPQADEMVISLIQSGREIQY